MQGTEHDISLFLALGCAADFLIKIVSETKQHAQKAECSSLGDSAVFSLLATRPFFVTGDSAVFSLLILAYLHTYIPTYLHTCIPAYLHTCKPAYLHTCMPQEEFARAFRIGGE